LTLSGKYAEIISDLGDAIDLSDDASEGYQLTLDHLKHERDSYSGVSLDEEMTDMITYQRSYEASAKIIKIADELLVTIINMV
jgi:flagellar hook-associated protein 1 FlgK